MQWTTPTWTGHGWSTTPPFPTPSLTASSLSSSSFYGEKSPVLAPPGSGQSAHRNFDVPSMTCLPPARSLDDLSAHQFAARTNFNNGDQAYRPASFSHHQHEGDIKALSSSISGLAMSERAGRVSDRSMDSAPLHLGSTLTEPSPPAPLLIPMQPTGAGVPLTSVVETLSSKGSKAAAEDPDTVAAAYKLSQWGIGIGPGINPKVASSRNGNHGRGRSTASEPPIVNTGNSGPMCVQPGDWICTSCGFVVSTFDMSSSGGMHQLASFNISTRSQSGPGPVVLWPSLTFEPSFLSLTSSIEELEASRRLHALFPPRGRQ